MLHFAFAVRGCDIDVFVVAGRSGENDSPMIVCGKAPAAASCQSSGRSALCISCSKLAVTYKEGIVVQCY